MEATQYLAFVPLLLYGIGLSILMSEWKRLFIVKEWFLPYSVFTIILTETALYNIFIYIQLVKQMAGIDYLSYLSMLLPPFLFLIATNTFTPDRGTDTKEYFIKQMPIFFTLMALFVGSHFLYTFNEPMLMSVARVVTIVLLFTIGYTRKVWLIYVLVPLWLLSLIVRGGITIH